MNLESGRGKQSFMIHQETKVYKKRDDRRLIRKVNMPIENQPNYRESAN